MGGASGHVECLGSVEGMAWVGSEAVTSKHNSLLDDHNYNVLA